MNEATEKTKNDGKQRDITNTMKRMLINKATYEWQKEKYNTANISAIFTERTNKKKKKNYNTGNKMNDSYLFWLHKHGNVPNDAFLFFYLFGI